MHEETHTVGAIAPVFRHAASAWFLSETNFGIKMAVTTISPDILRQEATGLRVPPPHDLLRNDGARGRFLPEALFIRARLVYRRRAYASGRKTSPFALYRREDIVFVHVPKNAGTFINSIVYPGLPAERSTEINAHHSAQYLARLDRRAFEALPKFAILRHPAARLKSAFNYLKFKTPFETDRAFAARALAPFADFEAFCRTITPEGFAALLDWPHFQPQVSFLCDPAGRLMVDALTTFEGMETGLARLGAAFGKRWPAIEVRTDTERPSQPAMDFVTRWYAGDLRLWEIVRAAPEDFCQVAAAPSVTRRAG
ncbi:hypothetical protein P73_0702 [Celeribacter indicus]|uniref:Sulfotransferase family protein n=2 Tax=Celeribacter indicus TaxID=1208324 RepID=A0A0B5DYV9_9RHOB|nr:hypothetical protein P73_0702 [Celeribacter indicus]